MRSRSVRTFLALLAAVAVGVPVVVSGSPAQAAPLGSFSCLPANSLENANPPASLMAGRLVLPNHPAVSIGTSSTVNWALNPYGDASWRTYFLSLKWLESLTRAYQQTHDSAYLDRALTIAHSFAVSVPAGGGPAPAQTWNGMYAGQRATVLTCLDTLRPGQSWLRTTIVAHGTWLAAPAHDPGDWNQGVDAALGLLGAACREGSSTWASTALSRFSRMIQTTIDSQGAVGEQAPGYGQYLYSRWGLVASKTAECGLAVPSAIAARRALLADFLAWSTEPNGNGVQLGDSIATPFASVPGSALAYTASLGAAGMPPAATSVIFWAGYAYGRDAWSPYTSSTYYSVRFGRGAAYHGHSDHTAVTFYALGHQLLVDSGHYGYTPGAYRTYLKSPQAHNTLTLPGVSFNTGAWTTLVEPAHGAAWQSYTMSDTAWGGRTRRRDLLVDTSAKVLVAVDRATRATTGSAQQLWHLPVGAKVVVASRAKATATTADGKAQVVLIQLALPGSTLPAGAIGVVSGRTSPSYQGWVSTAIGRRQAAPVVVMGRNGTSFQMLTIAAAVTPGAFVNAWVTRTSTGATLTVTAGGHVTTVRIATAGTLSE